MTTILARVKQDSKHKIIMAWGGATFNKEEWREVPPNNLAAHSELDFMASNKKRKVEMVTEEVDGLTLPLPLDHVPFEHDQSFLDSLPHEDEETAAAPKVGRPKK